MARDGLHRWPDGDRGWKFRLLAAEDLIILGRVNEARPLLNATEMPSGASLRARLKIDRARLAMSLQPETGPKLMSDALDAALAARDPAVICAARLRMGELATGVDESETYYRKALAEAELQRDPYLESWAQVDLGFIRARASRFDEAIPFLDEARDNATRCGARSLLASALGNLGWCYFMLGDFDRAEDVLKRAEALSAEIGLGDFQQRWLGELGNIYMVRGELDRAADHQRRAATLAGDAGNHAWVAIAYHNLAQIALDRGDLPAAESFINQALDIKRGLGDGWSLAYSEWLAAVIDTRKQRYAQAERGFRAVIEQAPYVHAPELKWQAYGGLASLYQQTGKTLLADEQYRKAIDTIDSEWDRLKSDDWKITFLAPDTMMVFFREYVDFLIARGQSETALEVAESSRARVLNQRLQHRGAIQKDFRIRGLLSRAKESRTVILSYWLSGAGQSKSSVWVIRSGRLSRYDLPPAKDIAQLVQKYTDVIRQGGDPLARYNGAASALYQAVLQPVRKLIPPGSNVIIVPDGALHQLAFETLVVPDPQPHYWIEDATIAIAPSLRALGGAEHRQPRAPKLLLMGDPLLTGQEFPPLANVQKQIAVVKEQFPADSRTVITGARAVPTEYQKIAPAGFSDILFATHATINQESPLNSAIILSHQGESYKLYARDVAAVPLTAEVVTLSACSSAGAKTYSGEGLMGFAWAFLQAGAHHVIATLWEEDDAASVDLMGTLYRGLVAGKTPAEALRAAKLTLLRSGSAHRLPYYWGPLQVFTRRIGG